MKVFPECLNRLRRCVRVGLNSVGGRGKKGSCRVSVCLILLSHCSRCRLLLFNCRWGAPKFLCMLTILSHIITPHANQSNDRSLPFERVIPLEMTEIFFFLFASQTGATYDGLPIEGFDFASFFFFFFFFFCACEKVGVITVYLNSLNYPLMTINQIQEPGRSRIKV